MKEIFISHRRTDKIFADIVEAFLATCGIPSDLIFCSSLPGNDVQCEISKEIKSSLRTSRLNIVILSDSYYTSPYCQNEAGIIWFNDTKKVVFALPEINENLMEGFLNSENIIRRMSNRSDILTVSDILSDNFESFIKSSAKLDANIERLVSQYESALQKRIKNENSKSIPQANALDERILSDELSDDEKVVLKYFYDSQSLFIDSDCLDIQNWLNENQISDIRVDNGLQLLLEDKMIECVTNWLGMPDEFKLLMPTYRNLRKISDESKAVLFECFSKHRANEVQKSKNEINNLIFKGYSNEEILLIQYINDLERASLYCGWQTEKEVDSITTWEKVNELDCILSSKYSDVLKRLEIRKYIEPSALSSYGNVKEYKIKDTYLKAIKNLSIASQEKIKRVIQDYKIPSDDELPF